MGKMKLMTFMVSLIFVISLAAGMAGAVTVTCSSSSSCYTGTCGCCDCPCCPCPCTNPPEINVEITPDPAYPDDSLTCTAEVSDVDGDLDHVDYEWFVEGILVRTQTKSVSGYSDIETDVLSSSFTEEGDTVVCVGTVYDSEAQDDTDEDEIYIDTPFCNKPPEILQIEITPKTPDTNDNLDCDVEVYDFDGNLDHVLFKWHVGSVIVRTVSVDVSGTLDYAADQLSSSWTDAGDNVICEAIVYDEMLEYDSDTDDSYIGDGENFPPEVDYLEITPSEPETEDDITCDADVSDTDGDLFDLTFRWYVNGGLVRTQVKSVSGYSDGGTDVLPHTFTDYEDLVKCDVTVRDSESMSDSDYSTVSVAPAPQPGNDPPIVTSVDITPSNPEATDDLQCDAVLEDIDGNLDHVIIKWRVEGAIVRTVTKGVSGYSDSESDTLSFTFTSYEDTVICEVIVYDDEGEYDSDTNYVTIEACEGDPPPVIDSIYVTPSNPDVTDILACHVDVSDLDGDLGTLHYTWKVNGITVRMQSYSVYGFSDSRTDLLSASYTEYGDHVICEAEVVDLTYATDWDQDDVTVNGGVVLNPPSVDTIAIIPTSPDTDDDITCDVDVSDNDGNLEYVDFKWYVNGLLKRSVTKSVSGYSDTETDVLQDMYTNYGNVVKCDVTVHDTTSLSDHDYNQVTVQSTYQGNPPNIAELPDRWTEVSEGIEQIDLWAYTSDAEDPDSSLDFSIEGKTHDEVIDCYVASNRYLRCYDAEDGGYSDVTVKVEDTQHLWDTDVLRVWVDEYCGGSCDRDPVIESIGFSPENPDEDDDIRCEVEVSDPDGDLDYLEFRWFVEGDLERTRTKEVSGYNDDDYDVLQASYFGDGDEVKCYVEVFDGEGNDDSDYGRLWVGEDGGDDDCNIDLFDLDVDDDEITFKIKNKGAQDEDVTYRIYIDDDKEYQRTVQVDEGDTRTFYYDDYDFDDDDHEYEIEVRAEADCGDTETERIWYQRGEGYSGSCGVQIRNLDYTQSIGVGGYASVEAQVKNTGSVKRYMTMRIYLDGVQTGMTSFWLDEGSSVVKSISFRPSVSGTKTLKVTVDATCGASDTVYGTMYIGTSPGPSPGACNYNGVCEYGESWNNCPYDCSQPVIDDQGPTWVDIRPSSLDVNQYKSKIITIDIDSFVSQEFQITVSGLPEDWTDYKPAVWVDGQKNAYVFVSPRQGGHYQFMVSVRSVTEGITYNKQVDMFVAAPGESGTMDGFTGMITGTLSNAWTVLIIVIVLSGVVVYFASRRLKHQHEVRMISFPRKSNL